MKKPDLDEIAATPGIHGVMLCDDAGGILATAGRADAPGPEAAVLAQAAHSAGEALGFRAGLGSCDEILQKHPHGRLRIRRVGDARFLLLWYALELREDLLDELLAAWPPDSFSSDESPHTFPQAAVATRSSEWDPFASSPAS